MRILGGEKDDFYNKRHKIHTWMEQNMPVQTLGIYNKYE